MQPNGPMILLSGNIRFMHIFAGVPCGGHQMTVGLSTTVIFRVSAGYFFRNVRDKATIII